jgi:hypothetical protein
MSDGARSTSDRRAQRPDGRKSRGQLRRIRHHHQDAAGGSHAVFVEHSGQGAGEAEFVKIGVTAILEMEPGVGSETPQVFAFEPGEIGRRLSARGGGLEHGLASYVLLRRKNDCKPAAIRETRRDDFLCFRSVNSRDRAHSLRDFPQHA